MTRHLQIKLPDLPQHLVQRGVNPEPYFCAEEDYHCYLHWLMKSAADYRCAHPYLCAHDRLRSSSGHAENAGGNQPSDGVGRSTLCAIYQSDLQAHRNLVGGPVHVQRRPGRAVFSAVLALHRTQPYAGRHGVIDPGQYRWSSYRHNGLGHADERLTPAECLALGQTDHDRQATYRTLFRPNSMKPSWPIPAWRWARGNRWGTADSASRCARRRG